MTKANGAGEQKIGIRMYNVGFGDCFLVSLPGKDRRRLVLIDCGVLTWSRTKNLDKVLDQLFADINELGRGTVDVIVATHHHEDHVKGFTQEVRWAGVNVSEVWMPWTEDPANPEATRIREIQIAGAASKVKELQAAQGDAHAALVHAWDWNASAMATLHSGFAGAPTRYYLPQPDGQPRSTSFKTDALPGVTVHLLGPLLQADLIRDTNPPDAAKYQFDGVNGFVVAGPDLPFDPMPTDQFEKAHKRLKLTPDEQRAITQGGHTDGWELLESLYGATNGTSLMFALEVGDNWLLFPGDAQWRTWYEAMEDQRKSAILTRTTFYKVGHHGSTNATPVRFVTDFFNNVKCAIGSVAPTSNKNWIIPRPSLIEAMRARCPVYLTEEIADIAQDFKAASDGKDLGFDLKTDDALFVDVAIPVWHSAQ